MANLIDALVLHKILKSKYYFENKEQNKIHSGESKMQKVGFKGF